MEFEELWQKLIKPRYFVCHVCGREPDLAYAKQHISTHYDIYKDRYAIKALVSMVENSIDKNPDLRKLILEN
jgi:hypothetical protein